MEFSDLLMTFCSLKSVCKNALTEAQFGSRSLLNYRLLIHVHISQFTQFSLVQSKAQINKQFWPARSQRRHFAGKPVVAQPVNRLSVSGRVKKKARRGICSSSTQTERLFTGQWWRREMSAVFSGYRNLGRKARRVDSHSLLKGRLFFSLRGGNCNQATPRFVLFHPGLSSFTGGGGS